MYAFGKVQNAKMHKAKTYINLVPLQVESMPVGQNPSTAALLLSS